jgi:hypothetical protein
VVADLGSAAPWATVGRPSAARPLRVRSAERERFDGHRQAIVVMANQGTRVAMSSLALPITTGQRQFRHLEIVQVVTAADVLADAALVRVALERRALRASGTVDVDEREVARLVLRDGHREPLGDGQSPQVGREPPHRGNAAVEHHLNRRVAGIASGDLVCGRTVGHDTSSPDTAYWTSVVFPEARRQAI